MNMPPLPNEVTTEHEKRVTFPVILFFFTAENVQQKASVCTK